MTLEMHQQLVDPGEPIWKTSPIPARRRDQSKTRRNTAKGVTSLVHWGTQSSVMGLKAAIYETCVVVKRQNYETELPGLELPLENQLLSWVSLSEPLHLGCNKGIIILAYLAGLLLQWRC